MSQGHLIGILNDEMNEGDVLVAAAGTIPADLTKLFANGGKEIAPGVWKFLVWL